MPEGKVIEYAQGEYPELDGIEVGSPVKFNGEATVEDLGEGRMGLRIGSMTLETESPATKEFGQMRNNGTSKQQVGAGAGYTDKDGEDF